MKKIYILLFASIVLFSACASKEEQKIELLQEAAEAMESVSSKEDVEETVEKYGEKIREFDDDLSAEEYKKIESSEAVSRAYSKYNLLVNSKSLEFDLY
jgi:PBP1b-binding outer membrane lipoprotein LpoB